MLGAPNKTFVQIAQVFNRLIFLTFFPLFIALTLSNIAKYVGFFLASPRPILKSHSLGESPQFFS